MAGSKTGEGWRDEGRGMEGTEGFPANRVEGCPVIRSNQLSPLPSHPRISRNWRAEQHENLLCSTHRTQLLWAFHDVCCHATLRPSTGLRAGVLRSSPRTMTISWRGRLSLLLLPFFLCLFFCPFKSPEEISHRFLAVD